MLQRRERYEALTCRRRSRTVPLVQTGSTQTCSSYCGKGDPFQGLKLGSCLTLGNELSEETHVLTKQEILLGKGGEQKGKGTQENSVTWLAVSGFMVMGLVSGLSSANHSDSESFLVVHALFS